MEGAAVDIIVENLNDQSDLVGRIDVTIKEGVHLVPCEGGGPLLSTAQYDFRIPVEDAVVNRTFSKPHKFAVNGKEKDRLTVSIGPEHLGDVDWGWIYYVDVGLVLESGKRLVASDLVLMDAERNDSIIEYVSRWDSLEQAKRACIKSNMAIVDRAAAAPGKHSAAIGALREGVRKLDVLDREASQSTPTTTPAPPPMVPTTNPDYAPPSGTWIAQLFSVAEAEGLPVARARADAESAKYGVRVDLLKSSDYSSLNAGYWVGYYGHFRTTDQAQLWCGSSGSSACMPRHLVKSS
jgi:hypothetical protein